MDKKSDYEALLHAVCVEHGWCGGIVNGRLVHVDDLIPQSGQVEADQFVDWLFEAEGLDPMDDPLKWKSHKEALRDTFVRFMGSDVVDASRLTASFD